MLSAGVVVSGGDGRRHLARHSEPDRDLRVQDGRRPAEQTAVQVPAGEQGAAASRPGAEGLRCRKNVGRRFTTLKYLQK